MKESKGRRGCRTVASLQWCKEEMTSKMKIVVLEVSDNLNIKKRWALLSTRVRPTSDSRTSWLNGQCSNLNPWNMHITAEDDRTFQHSLRAGLCQCVSLWRIKLLWLSSVAVSCSWWRCSLNRETDGGLTTLLMNTSLGSLVTDSCQKREGLGQQGG